MRKKLVIILFILILFSLLIGCQQSIEKTLEKGINNLTKSNPYLRKQAIASLGSTSDIRAVLPIAKMLNDIDQGVINQAYIELNNLRSTGLLVDQKILESLNSFTINQQHAVKKYLIIAHQNGIDLQKSLLAVLPKANDISVYSELLIYLHSRANSTLYPLLLADLPTDKGGVAANILLLLDQYGYTPSRALIDELINQGFEISEATGQLLVQFACRESYSKPNDPNAQYQILYQDGNIIINDNSSASLERCRQGDALFNKLPNNLTYLSRLAILHNEKDIPTEIITMFNKFIEMNHEKLVSMVLNDSEILYNNKILKQRVIDVFANNDSINNWLNNEIKTTEVISVLAPEDEDQSPNEENNSEQEQNSTDTQEIKEKAILIINDEGFILGSYHWYLPEDYRPKSNDDIRYVLHIPNEGSLTIVDIIKKVLVFEAELTEDTDVLQIINDFIKANK